MVETLSATAWCAEVLQSRAMGASTRAHVAAVAALAAAADRCRDLVAVTDDHQRILVSFFTIYDYKHNAIATCAKVVQSRTASYAYVGRSCCRCRPLFMMTIKRYWLILFAKTSLERRCLEATIKSTMKIICLIKFDGTAAL